MEEPSAPEASGAAPAAAAAPVKPRVWPVFVSMLVMLIGTLLFGLVIAFVVAVPSFTNGKPPPPEELQKLIEATVTSPWMIMLSVIISSSMLAGVSVLGARMSPGSSHGSSPSGPSGRARRRLALALPAWSGAQQAAWAVAPVFAFSAGGIASALTLLVVDERSEQLKAISVGISSARGVTEALLTFVVVVVAPCAEELFFRGYAQTRLVERWGPAAGITVAAAMFGAFHMDPQHAVFAFALGLALGVVRYRSGSVLPSIVAHLVNNTIATVAARVSGDDADDSKGELAIWIAVYVVVAAVAGFVFVRLTRR